MFTCVAEHALAGVTDPQRWFGGRGTSQTVPSGYFTPSGERVVRSLQSPGPIQTDDRGCHGGIGTVMAEGNRGRMIREKLPSTRHGASIWELGARATPMNGVRVLLIEISCWLGKLSCWFGKCCCYLFSRFMVIFHTQMDSDIDLKIKKKWFATVCLLNYSCTSLHIATYSIYCTHAQVVLSHRQEFSVSQSEWNELTPWIAWRMRGQSRRSVRQTAAPEGVC